MSKNWQDLSVLVVGCGSIGRRHGRVLYGMGVKDIRACDPSAEQMEAFKAEIPATRSYTSYEEALKDRPDTVFILTPTKMHIPMATQAVEAGCHVFLEKPLADSFEGVDDFIELVNKHNKKVAIGLCFRYHEGLLRMKKLVREGAIGRVVSVRSFIGEPFHEIRPDYKDTYYVKYSGAFEQTHFIDLAVWFADQPIRSVNSVFGPYGDTGFESPDTVEILIGFEDRCAATVHMNLHTFPRRCEVELVGTGGTIRIDFASWTEYTISLYTSAERKWQTFTGNTQRDDMFRDEDRSFLEAVADDTPVTCSITDAYQSLIVTEACKRIDPSTGSAR